MRERNSNESSSPLATVEEIQRRLIRPSLPPPTIRSRNPLNEELKSRGYYHPQVFQNLNEIHRNGDQEPIEKETARKLEDYLDPVLLSVISSKLNNKRKEEGESRQTVKSFEWPTEELKGFFEEKRTEKRNWKDCGAIKLGDNELERDVDDDDEEACSPFRRFEKSVSKLFKR